MIYCLDNLLYLLIQLKIKALFSINDINSELRVYLVSLTLSTAGAEVQGRTPFSVITTETYS